MSSAISGSVERDAHAEKSPPTRGSAPTMVTRWEIDGTASAPSPKPAEVPNRRQQLLPRQQPQSKPTSQATRSQAARRAWRRRPSSASEGADGAGQGVSVGVGHVTKGQLPQTGQGAATGAGGHASRILPRRSATTETNSADSNVAASFSAPKTRRVSYACRNPKEIAHTRRAADDTSLGPIAAAQRAVAVAVHRLMSQNGYGEAKKTLKIKHIKY